MYNGIGLKTARGSGTNGYVIKNVSTITKRKPDYLKSNEEEKPMVAYKEPDQGILLHEKKRKIELQCLELQIQLEDQDLEESVIDERVDALRKKLSDNLERGEIDKIDRKKLKAYETHKLAEAKILDNAKFEKAFGIKDFVEGKAFDQQAIASEKLLKKTEHELRKM